MIFNDVKGINRFRKVHMRILHSATIFFLASLLVSCKNADEPKPQFSSFLSANEYLVNQYPDLKEWCHLEAIPTRSVFVKPQRGTGELFFTGADNVENSLSYTKVVISINPPKFNDSALIINSDDKKKLDSFLEESFNQTESNQDARILAALIGAEVDDNHLNSINNVGKLRWSDKLLSIIYNTCLGNPKHDNLIFIKDNKLQYLRDTPLNRNEYTFIDTTAFIKWINSGITGINSPKDFKDSLTRHNIIIKKPRKFDFVYNDFRADKIYVGYNVYSYRDHKPVKDTLLKYPERLYVLKKESSLEDIINVQEAIADLCEMPLCIIDDSKTSKTLWSSCSSGKEIKTDNVIGNEPISFIQRIFNNKCLFIPLLGLAIILLISILCFTIYILIQKHRKENIIAMKIDSINNLADRLIKIYSSEEDHFDQEIDMIVRELKRLCGKEFDDSFVDARDLIAWKERFNKKHSPKESAVVTMPARQTKAGLRSNNDFTSLSPDASIEEILRLFDRQNGTHKLSEYQVLIQKQSQQSEAETSQAVIPKEGMLPSSNTVLFSTLGAKSSILDILKVVDTVLNTGKASDYERFVASATEYEHRAKLYEPLYNDLAKISQREKIDIRDVLDVFEKEFSCKAGLSKKYKMLIDNVREQEPVIKLFSGLVESKTEGELMLALDLIRKDYRNLPRVDTVAGLIDSIDRGDSFSKQIAIILKHIDTVSGNDNLSKAQDSFIRRAVVYDRCKRMVKGIDSTHDLDTVLSGALERFMSTGQSIEGSIDFVEIFKPAAPTMKDKEEILRIHSEIERITGEFQNVIQTISQKDNLDYWDRVAIILSSISKCSIPILSIIEPNNKLNSQSGHILLNIKNDLLLSYITRYFLRDSQKEVVTAEQFQKNVSEQIYAAIEKYNNELAKGEPTVSIQASDFPIAERVGILESSIKKNRSYEATLSFIDRMWDNMVKEFLEKAKNCNDESYILEQALNIAYHTADFLDHVKGGRDIAYCYNYAFLLNSFNPEKARSLEFKLHDYSKSTAYSDFVYELADKLGIDHLKILIDNYFIKP